MKRCEKLKLMETEWSALPNMHTGRSFFTPCKYNKYLYLCGNGSDRIESFDPDSLVFTQINARLPENSKCCAFVEDDKLIIISEKCTSKWSIGSGQQLAKVATTRHEEWDVSCNMAPVVDEEKKEAFLSVRGACYCLKSDGGEIRFVAR